MYIKMTGTLLCGHVLNFYQMDIRTLILCCSSVLVLCSVRAVPVEPSLKQTLVSTSESTYNLQESSSGDSELLDVYIPVDIEDNIFTDNSNYASDDWKPYLEEKSDGVSSPVGYCSAPIGITHEAPHTQVGFSLSSTVGVATHAHLNSPHAWQSQRLHEKTFIQVEFVKVMMVSGIVTQGSPTSTARVTQFVITYSQDCVDYFFLTDSAGDITVTSNLAANSTSTTMFDQLFLAKCLRIIPTQIAGEEAALRFELLGCDLKHCDQSVEPAETLGSDQWKRVAFDTEKIISSIKINVVPSNTITAPAFVVVYSRTCNFNGNGRHFLKENGTTKVFTLDTGSSSILITGEDWFPLRAHCIAVSQVSGETNVEEDFLQDFSVTFHGCDANEQHEAVDSCGKARVRGRSTPNRKKRVVGGLPSIPGEWPWLVSLHFLPRHGFTDSSGLQHLCGGSLIHPLWVLTTAHCFDDAMGAGLSNESNWRVVLGEHNQAARDGTEQVHTVDTIFKHPSFVLDDDVEVLWDIALIKLSQPAIMSDYVNTICIEPNTTFPARTPCVTAGWGLIDVGGVGVELPNHAFVNLLSDEECRARYEALPADHEVRQTVAIVDSVLCAMADVNGTDSCQGDSGGPLICYHDDHWIQVGIVSIGYECGDIRYPAIYTRVNYFYAWINDVITANT